MNIEYDEDVPIDDKIGPIVNNFPRVFEISADKFFVSITREQVEHFFAVTRTFDV